MSEPVLSMAPNDYFIRWIAIGLIIGVPVIFLTVKYAIISAALYLRTH